MTSVPCNGCRECCINSVIFLYEEDMLHNFDTQLALNSATGLYGYRLRQKGNGECIYLNELGCTVHERLPRACGEFDCRVLFKTTSRLDRKAAKGSLKKVFAAGKSRLDTLGGTVNGTPG